MMLVVARIRNKWMLTWLTRQFGLYMMIFMKRKLITMTKTFKTRTTFQHSYLMIAPLYIKEMIPIIYTEVTVLSKKIRELSKKWTVCTFKQEISKIRIISSEAIICC